jgi:hypothetical protein
VRTTPRRNRPGALALAVAVAAGLAWTWSTGAAVAAGDADTAIAPGTGTRGQALWIAAELVLLVGGAALACGWHGRWQRGRRREVGPGPGAVAPQGDADEMPEPTAAPPDATRTVADVHGPPEPARGRAAGGRMGRRGWRSRIRR